MRPHLAYSAAALLSAVALAAPAPRPSIAADDSSRFTYYEMPTTLAGPCDLCTGPDGALWAQDLLVDKITRLDPDTGVVEEYDIPYEESNTTLPSLRDIEPQRLALACAIQPGQDGMLYAAAGLRSQFLRINPTTKEITVYTPPPPNSALGNVVNFNDLYAADDGMYFTMTTANTLFHFNYETEEFTPYIVPTALASPIGTFLASDGNIYVCEFLASKIAKFDTKTKAFTGEYQIPLLNDGLGLGPAVMRAESPKGTIWWTNLLGNSMGSMNIYTNEITTIPDPILGGIPSEDTVDSDGYVWYSTMGRATLNRLDPATGEIEMIVQPGSDIIPLPVSVPPPLDIAIHYGPGNYIWFTEVLNNRIGRYEL